AQKIIPMIHAYTHHGKNNIVFASFFRTNLSSFVLHAYAKRRQVMKKNARIKRAFYHEDSL
ncbi:hypothetical protein MCZ47_19355, partial [Bacillus altitudinis]|uniref:hypothetical protein n=1 Tax=Bacillus altitudinis TaxID=293387 RepID=UPI00227E05B4